ncbi:hypothetical protein [Cupriavidus basilensis]|uniref:Uncharacterized protein n=1 Tax=Cupriavidus basilensis TaxID=68895 RepID=A0A0C4YKD7_9BURK|nr:hypothetical protein [Cupriavidus basilensis]AJG23533.1 hypothetical protein RR42_s1945 [Cupriavidus basilensis]
MSCYPSRFPIRAATGARQLAGLCLTVLAAAPTLAQVPPDAGALRQQIEPELPPALPRPVAPDRAAAPPPLRQHGEATVTVTAFRFAGNKQMSEAQLAPAGALPVQAVMTVGDVRVPLVITERNQ